MIFIQDKKQRNIFIVPDAFEFSYLINAYSFAIQSAYKIGFSDTSVIERDAHKYMHCSLDGAMVEQLGIFNALQKTEVQPFINNKQLHRATINLSTPSDTNFPHTHANENSLIYYMNVEWKPEWGGDTVFYEDNLESVVHTSLYQPNKLIFFDGEIPHSIKPQSFISPHYRFTLAMFCQK